MSAIALEGLELFFNSNDHRPPHFHAERPGEWEVRIFFLRTERDMVEVNWAFRRPPVRVLQRLCAIAATARPVLLKEWEQKVAVSSRKEH